MMKKNNSVSLKQAQADPKAMKKFIREHKGDQIESADFDKVMGSMLKKPASNLKAQ